MPSNGFDYCYLSGVFELHDWDGKRAILQEALRVVKPGGIVQALSVCCDDQKELYELAVKLGYDTKEFEAKRLTNGDIVKLKPNDASFFRSVLVIPNRQRLVEYLHEQGFPEAKLEHMWEFNRTFPINRISIALRWHRAM